MSLVLVSQFYLCEIYTCQFSVEFQMYGFISEERYWLKTWEWMKITQRKFGEYKQKRAKDRTSSRESFVGNTYSRKILMEAEPKNDSKN